MLQDRLNGKMMEVESMCGVVVKKAEELDVDVPTIQADTALQIDSMNRSKEMRG